MFNSTRAFFYLWVKDIPMNGKLGVSSRVLKKLQINWREILGLNIGLKGNIRSMEYIQGHGMGICSIRELGQVQGLLAGLWCLFFLWTSLLTRSSVEMTGMSRRGNWEGTGTEATWTPG